MGGIAMADRRWKESKKPVARALEQEATEPLAALLLNDISLELEADHRPRAASRSHDERSSSVARTSKA
jgi:hypothetical protein